MMTTQTQSTKLLWASYLKYEGNSTIGSDCERVNEHQIPLLVIKHAATQGESLGFSVETHKVLGFGREIKVGGTIETWDQAWVQVAQDISKQIVPNPNVVDVSKKGDRYFLLSLHGDSELELFKFPAQPLINIIKNGFVPLDLQGRPFFVATDQLTY